MSELNNYINQLIDSSSWCHLTRDDAARAFQIILMGGATPAQIASFLTALRMRGESVDEIAGAAQMLRSKAQKLIIPDNLQDKIVDSCGTGGDGKGMYNISTTVAFVLAGCGVPVTKHGNRSVSSKSGSSDVLSELGVKLDVDESTTLKCLDEAGVCFLAAPYYHRAMRHVGAIRQELKMRTIFNLLGPLINPANPLRQIIGVYDKKLVEVIANVLQELGAKHVWVVHGSDGTDELTTTGESYVAELKDSQIRTFTLNPADYGIPIVDDESQLQGGDANVNAQSMKYVLRGGKGAYRDIVLLNSAAGLIVAGKVDNITDGIALAAQSIDSGKANDALCALVTVSNAC